MKNRYKLLIILEAIILYGPAISMLTIGYRNIDKFLLGLQDVQYLYKSIEIIILLIVGTLGMLAAISILIKIIIPNTKAIPANIAKILILLMLVALMYKLVLAISSGLRWEIINGLIVMPLVATIHFVYLGRDYLFINNANKAIKKDV